MADRVLIEIVTAANMAGVNQAKAGFLGMHKSTLALAAALGVVVVAGKSAIENTEAMDKAHLSLQQAATATHQSFDGLQSAFDTWSETNKRYIADQYDAETALASFVRAGSSAKDSMRELNDALDLSVIKGMPVSEMATMITLALAGNTRGVKFLGISTEELHKIQKSHLTTEQKHHAILMLIEQRTKGGRKATDDMKQSTQALNKDWQDMSTRIGPPLLKLIGGVADQADRLVGWLDKLGKDKSWNKNVSAFLGTIQTSIIQDVQWVEAAIKDIQSLGNWLNKNTGVTKAPSGNQHWSGKASGGPVAAGQAYTVGERGPETLVMGSSSGAIIPNGAGSGGASVHLHIHGGIFMDHGPTIDALSVKIAQRLRMTNGI